MIHNAFQGRIQDFKLGGAHLKKLRGAEGGAKNFGVFRVKNHDFTQKKIIYFPILGGAHAGCVPPGSAPAFDKLKRQSIKRHIQAQQALTRHNHTTTTAQFTLTNHKSTTHN